MLAMVYIVDVDSSFPKHDTTKHGGVCDLPLGDQGIGLSWVQIVCRVGGPCTSCAGG
jgi:hypothetical protein